MRRAYYIINIATFLLMAMYSSVSNTNYQFSHTVFMMCLVSLVSSGYMTFMEYTDTTDQDRAEQFTNIRNSYKKRMEEMNDREHTMNNLRMENQDLVRDLTYTKQVASDLATIIEEQEQTKSNNHPDQNQNPNQPQVQEHTGQTGQLGWGGVPSNDSSRLNESIHNEMMEQQYNDDNTFGLHDTTITGMKPISNNSDIGPPESLITMSDTTNLDQRMKEYNDAMPRVTPPSTKPDWLKPMKV